MKKKRDRVSKRGVTDNTTRQARPIVTTSSRAMSLAHAPSGSGPLRAPPPFRSERDMARELVADDEFVEIYVDAPLEVCEMRDPKGLYKKARAGEIKNFTGIDSAYEAPLSPDITLKSGELEVDALAGQIIDYLENTGRI